MARIIIELEVTETAAFVRALRETTNFKGKVYEKLKRLGLDITSLKLTQPEQP